MSLEFESIIKKILQDDKITCLIFDDPSLFLQEKREERKEIICFNTPHDKDLAVDLISSYISKFGLGKCSGITIRYNTNYGCSLLLRILQELFTQFGNGIIVQISDELYKKISQRSSVPHVDQKIDFLMHDDKMIFTSYDENFKTDIYSIYAKRIDTRTIDAYLPLVNKVIDKINLTFF